MIRVFSIIALMLAAPAMSQIVRENDGNAPVKLENAERVELQSRADRLIVSGSVKITQGNRKLDADRVTIAYSRAPSSDAPSPDINRVDAFGNVVFTSGDQVARGNMAIYDLDRRIITMLGNVALTQGTSRLSGGRLVIDLTSGSATIDGRSSSAPATGSASRVTGRFNVPQHMTP